MARKDKCRGRNGRKDKERGIKKNKMIEEAGRNTKWKERKRGDRNKGKIIVMEEEDINEIRKEGEKRYNREIAAADCSPGPHGCKGIPGCRSAEGSRWLAGREGRVDCPCPSPPHSR